MQANISIEQTFQISAEEFCSALAAKLVLLNRRQLPLEDPAVERIFGKIVTKMRQIAIDSHNNKDKEFSRAILDVLSGIRPNQNTGAFDQLWATFRRLQPGLLGVSNPLYPALEIGISTAVASGKLDHIHGRWRTIIDDSANKLAKVI